MEQDPNNRFDQFAVKVLYQGKQIGYIKKIHAQTISEELSRGKKVRAEVKNFDLNGVVNSVLLKVSISD